MKRLKRVKQCKCGCGLYARLGNSYVNGHNWTGKKRSEENRLKLSIANSGKNNSMYGLKGKDSPRYGKKHTEESIGKMKEYWKGKNAGCDNPMWGVERPDGTRRKISESLKQTYAKSGHPLKGRKHTEEAKAKKRDSVKSGIDHPLYGIGPMYGKKHKPESRQAMSISTSGENHPNWKGGISKVPYCAIWHDPEFKEMILERDNFECKNPFCWGTSSRIVRHHIDGDKENCHPSNIITICNSCNVRAEGRRKNGITRKRWRRHYRDIASSITL